MSMRKLVVLDKIKLDANKNKRGREIKFVTQVMHIVYVSCALMNNNLKVPYLVLYFIYMHRWSTLCYFVYWEMISTMDTIAYLWLYTISPKSQKNKIKHSSKDLLHPITLSQTFSTKSHHIYLCSKCNSKYGFVACVF